MKRDLVTEVLAVVSSGRFLGLVVVVSLACVVSSCGRVKRIFADCDYALRLKNEAMAINSPEDIDPAFTAVAINRPRTVRTVAEAQEYLLNASVDVGCEDKVQSSYLLGTLYLRQRRYPEAARFLVHSVRAQPTMDGFLALAEAYDNLGEPQLAQRMRVRAQLLTVEQ